MNENREPKKYLVAGYVKNALLWKNRNPEEMIAYNRFYFEEQLKWKTWNWSMSMLT